MARPDDHSLRLILDSTPIGMLLVDRQGLISFANARACHMLGWTDESELLGSHINTLIPERFHGAHDVNRHQYQHEEARARPMGKGRDLLARCRDGRELPVEIGLSPVTLKDGDYVLISLLDISDRHRARDLEEANSTLAYMATHDPLTHLPNRQHLLHRLDEWLATDDPLSVVFIDLDGFKAVNDCYGHIFGDKVLTTVADLLRDNIRQSDLLGRLGGDEFLLIFHGMNNEADIQRVMEDIRLAVASLACVEARPIAISASIGAVTRHPGSSLSSEELIKLADSLMYQAKSAGRNRIVCGQAE